jgi:hypothetical protein
MPREAFEGYDKSVNIDMDSEEALKLLPKTDRQKSENDSSLTDQ